jgi:hypothetical protein
MRIPAREVRDPVGQVLRWAGGQVATWIRWTLPELKRGPAAGNRHGGAPRGAIPVAPGSPRAVNAASRLASVIEDPVCALRRSAAPSFGVGTRKRDDPRAKRRAETRGDGKMEGNEGDVRWKEQGSSGRRAWRTIAVTLRCPSEARAIARRLLPTRALKVRSRVNPRSAGDGPYAGASLGAVHPSRLARSQACAGCVDLPSVLASQDDGR